MTLNITKQKIRKLAMMFNQTQKRRPNAKRRRHGKTFNKYKKESMLGRKTMRGGSYNPFKKFSNNAKTVFTKHEDVGLQDILTFNEEDFKVYIEGRITRQRFNLFEKNRIQSIINEFDQIKGILEAEEKK